MNNNDLRLLSNAGFEAKQELMAMVISINLYPPSNTFEQDIETNIPPPNNSKRKDAIEAKRTKARQHAPNNFDEKIPDNPPHQYKDVF